jgi:N-acetylmuramoyl-L-alanine amidase
LLRRSFICAVIFAALAPASSSAAGPRASDFEAPVRLPAAVAAQTGYVSPVQRAPHRFDLVGFRWHGDAGTVAVRVRRASGWSDWMGLDATRSGAHGLRESEPAWSGGADAYQLRMTRPARAIRAHFVLVTGDRVHAAAAKTSAAAPAIVPRTAWDPTNQCPPREAPSYGRVDMAFVHNTVSANDYAATDTPAIVLAICRYHRNANHWNDIGYNFLVDKYGQVFEGRAGGVDQPVIGAQAQGYNRFSTGVSAIGTYSVVPFPAVWTLARLLAWKLNLTAAPAQGTILETSGGGSLNRFRAGAQVVFNRIAGHRDGDATDCPGNALYAQLPEIRRLTAADMAGLAPVARLSGSPGRTKVQFPQGTMVAGRLTVPDAGAGGRPIYLQRRAGSAWVTVGHTTTSDDGSWQLRLAAGWTRTYRAYWAGDATHRATATGSFTVAIVPKVTAQVAAGRVVAGGHAVVSGTVAPAKRIVIVVARKTKGVYRQADRVSAKVSHGRWSAVFTLHAAALYRFTVASRADARNLSGRAAAVFVRATRGAAGGASLG